MSNNDHEELTNNSPKRAEFFPSKSAEYIFNDLLPEWRKLFLEKNAGYGDMHCELGVRAQYVDINRKVGKVKRAVWEGKDIGHESVREVLLDVIGHAFLAIDLLDNHEPI